MYLDSKNRWREKDNLEVLERRWRPCYECGTCYLYHFTITLNVYMFIILEMLLEYKINTKWDTILYLLFVHRLTLSFYIWWRENVDPTLSFLPLSLFFFFFFLLSLSLFLIHCPRNPYEKLFFLLLSSILLFWFWLNLDIEKTYNDLWRRGKRIEWNQNFNEVT